MIDGKTRDDSHVLRNKSRSSLQYKAQSRGMLRMEAGGEGAGEGAYQRAARGPSVNQVQVA